MATISNFDKRSYTWWWNSHISPKNSKWLQENLSDMDSKVKQMIKVIEEDADSFARRAEMYYKRRPELLKLVEEFYRAYRALAEKYDNATGVIRQAHRTMAEAFPDHVPSLLGDDALAGDVASEGGPRTPETMYPTHALFDPEEVLKDNAGLRHFHMKKTGAFTDEPGSLASKKGFKQFNEFGSREAEPGRAKFGEGRARKELNFHEGEEKDKIVGGGVLPKSEQVIRLEEDMKLLKESLAKVEAEKEADLLKYQQSLERLSNLESEAVRAKEDARHLNECASKAEIEVLTLKETLANFNIEKEASLLKYEQCLERISNLDKNLSCAQEDAGELNRRTREAETEAQTLKEELTLVKSEKEAIFVQNKQSLEVISHLENDLICAEENARIISEKADAAAKEIEKLKKDITRLTEENEALALQYQHCLVIISNLESKIASAEEEIQRLNGEIDVGLAKLRGAEDRCLSLERSNQSLQDEKELLELKVGSQDQELIDKQQELARLWSCIQEERLRFVEAETAFQTLQHLHSQSQEELKSLVSELQMKGQVLEDLEIRNRVLQDDVRKTEEENKSLSVINLSSSASMKDMENELSDLKETIAKLQEEVDLRVDQRNALQQEIYCLKEELNELNKKQSFIVEQVESVGLNPECIASRVKELRNDNLKLNDVFQREKSEKEALLGKLEIMEKLLEKNAVLENSLADLNAELDGVREKVKSLEESCEMLMAEKSTLSSENETLFVQLEMITENSHRLSEKSSLLESSLFDVNRELQGLRDKSNSLEHALQLVDREKDVLTTEKESLSSQLEIAQQRLEDSENRWKQLEGKSNDLETERESLLCTVEELRRSLDVEKQEHARVLELCEAKVTTLESSLSDVNAELEVVTEKSQSIENSVQLLKHQKEGLIVERESLSSQLEITRERLEESKRSIKDLEVKSNDLRKEKELSLSTIEELRGSLDTEKREHASILELHEAKFATLESSLRDVNCELEGLREKTQNLEHSLQVVHSEKAGLIIEKGSLSSQLELTQQKMEDFEKICEELEGETNDLSKEKELLLCTIEELRGSLDTEKWEHASILELHKAKFATLESSLRDVNCELEGLREKTQNLEHSLQVVHGEKAGLIIEKGSLSSQLETTQQKMEDFEKRCEELEGETNDLNKEKELFLCTIEELRGSLDTEKREHASILELHKAKFATLESSLRDVNCELEGLREKTQNLEHSLQVVHGEKAGLIIEKGSLSSQLEMTHQKMEDFKKRCEELEGETNDLEKEKQSLLGTVEELRSSLDVEKQDHASVLELYGTGLASLQSQILLLQEEGWHGKKKYEEELDKTIRANIEIFILQKGLQEMEGKCFTQSVECQRLVKTSEQLELSVCQLEHQNLKQEVEAKALLDQLKNVRMVMYQVALAFDIDVDTWDDDEILRDQMYLKKILDNLEDLRKSLKTALEENWQLMAEKSVLSTLLSQFRLEATELESIRSSLCEHLNVTTQKLLAVQSENHRILEMNEGLRQVVVEGEKKEEFSRNEIDSLLANLLKLQGAHQILQRQNSEVIEEKKSLMKEVLNLVKEKNALADESILLLHKTLFLSNLSLVFENFISEKSFAMQELGETVDRLCRVRNVLEMDVKVMVGKLDMTNAENLHLKDSLEKSEAELETVRLLSDQLKFDLANSNTLLTQKEMELSEAEKKLESAQSEKLEFQKALGDLAMEYEQLKVIKGKQEECISKLSEESERRRMETESLSEVISNLEAEMSVICRKHEETKISEQTLNSELEKGRNEFKLWENDAALLFTRLHISNVHEALFTDMAYELSKKCVILENSENSKAEEIYLLKEKVGSLEDKNGVLEAQIVSYVAGIESLKDCLNSLESHTLLQDKLQKAVDEEAKGVQSSGHVDADCEQTDNFDAKFPDGVSGLLDLQSRIVAIEKAVDNLEKLQIKDLQSQIHSRDDFLSTGRYGSSRQDDGELPKDIILDQISECSPLGVSKREAVEVNDPGLELWEATDASIDQAKKQEICTDEIPSSEVVFEKELCVIDKSEISKRFKDHSQNQEGSKMKILERLDSDSQKLTNLQIIVQDLKAKVEITEKSKKGKGIEYDTVREQLEEAEETIMKLFDMNSKLKKNIEEFCSDDGKSGRSFDDTEGNRSKRVSEHARRGSEKIGRLQLEVQKLQFLLLKFDGRKESQGKTSMIERSPRVVLRDYLYGTKTTHGHKQKKTRFCSCVRPPTKGD